VSWGGGGGRRTAEAAALLRMSDDVDQVAPFGNTLHVVGRDAERLRRAAAIAAEASGCTTRDAETSLEDVFIQFMGAAQDNMQ
jgi:ABC-2 type transport system ATP-binding protein